MTVSAEIMAQVADHTRKLLEERFGDDFVFDPILVRSRIDHDGDEFVEVKVVYDGDMDNLDPLWTAGISTREKETLRAMGVPGLPASFGFVEKSDWEAGPPK